MRPITSSDAASPTHSHQTNRGSIHGLATNTAIDTANIGAAKSGAANAVGSATQQTRSESGRHRADAPAPRHR
jgi:hypothetical protein